MGSSILIFKNYLNIVRYQFCVPYDTVILLTLYCIFMWRQIVYYFYEVSYHFVWVMEVLTYLLYIKHSTEKYNLLKPIKIS